METREAPTTKQPMPGDRLSGCTVIASVVFYDDGERPDSWIVLLLAAEPPYYRLIEVEDRAEAVEAVAFLGRYYNINEAVAAYADNGGDY